MSQVLHVGTVGWTLKIRPYRPLPQLISLPGYRPIYFQTTTIAVYKPTHKPLRTCISPGLISCSLRGDIFRNWWVPAGNTNNNYLDYFKFAQKAPLYLVSVVAALNIQPNGRLHGSGRICNRSKSCTFRRSVHTELCYTRLFHHRTSRDTINDRLFSHFFKNVNCDWQAQGRSVLFLECTHIATSAEGVSF